MILKWRSLREESEKVRVYSLASNQKVSIDKFKKSDLKGNFSTVFIIFISCVLGSIIVGTSEILLPISLRVFKTLRYLVNKSVHIMIRILHYQCGKFRKSLKFSLVQSNYFRSNTTQQITFRVKRARFMRMKHFEIQFSIKSICTSKT